MLPSDEAISLFDEVGDCFAPGACPEWSEGVARNDSQTPGVLPKQRRN
jgi:hypothetical protein